MEVQLLAHCGVAQNFQGLSTVMNMFLTVMTVMLPTIVTLCVAYSGTIMCCSQF